MTIYIYYVSCEFAMNFLPTLYKIPGSVTGPEDPNESPSVLHLVGLGV